MRIRVVVDGTKPRLFVNGAEQPSLIINDLKHAVRGGAVAAMDLPRVRGLLLEPEGRGPLR